MVLTIILVFNQVKKLWSRRELLGEFLRSIRVVNKINLVFILFYFLFSIYFILVFIFIILNLDKKV